MKFPFWMIVCATLVCVCAAKILEYFGMVRLLMSANDCGRAGCVAFQGGDYATGVYELVKAALDATVAIGLALDTDRREAIQDWLRRPTVRVRDYPYPPNIVSRSSTRLPSRPGRNYTMEELHIKQDNPMSVAIYEAFTGNSGPHHFKRDTIEWPDVKYFEDDGHFEFNLAVAPDSHKVEKRQAQFEVWNRISMHVVEHAEGNWEAADDGYLDDVAHEAAGAISTSDEEGICGRVPSEDEEGTAYFMMRMTHVGESIEDIGLNHCDDNSRY